MGDPFRRVDMFDPEQGPVRLSVVVPRGDDPWGDVAPVRGTQWESLVRIVSGESVSHAAHGWATPLVRELGPGPEVLLRRHATPCVMSTGGQCVGAGPDCRPGRKMPDCYEPPDADAAVVTAMLLELRAGRHVVVVVGPEFVLW